MCGVVCCDISTLVFPLLRWGGHFTIYVRTWKLHVLLLATEASGAVDQSLLVDLVPELSQQLKTSPSFVRITQKMMPTRGRKQTIQNADFETAVWDGE